MFYKFQDKYSKLMEDFGQVVDVPTGDAPAGTVASALTKDMIYGMTVGGGVNPRKRKKTSKKGVAKEDEAYQKELKKKFPTVKRPKIENMIVGRR